MQLRLAMLNIVTGTPWDQTECSEVGAVLDTDSNSSDADYVPNDGKTTHIRQ